ncbi:MAG: electron transfer flavoprotein subunit alpha [Clostridia bacterium]|nr:electron transfer flavoprotein subunit alpha [Clostridia bacterium]
MKKLVIHPEKIDENAQKQLIEICPFQAIEEENGRLTLNAACKMCGLCVRKGPPGAMTLEEQDTQTVDLEKWRGLAVFADQAEGFLHPVTLELIGKARMLADQIKHPVYVLMMGHLLREQAAALLNYGVDEIFLYDHPDLSDFLIEPYAAVAEDFIRKICPSVILVGATLAGRSLAPRIAARFRTGLTADCTELEIESNSDLIQIRPAFGGNIMARIMTQNSRPQLCTVRYKIFNAPSRSTQNLGRITEMPLDDICLKSRAQVLLLERKETGLDLTEAETIIAVGRGVKKQEDLMIIERLADQLQAKIACTRPLVEKGWFDPRQQIGLSGRTVSPKLIITVGVSGSVQFVSGMKGSDTIIAINKDPEAAIFNVAHHAFVGDWYEIVPRLSDKLDKASRSSNGGNGHERKEAAFV